MKLHLVIVAAGLGSRFRVTGVVTPKPLIAILGLPMILWVLGNFPLAPQDEIWIISRKEDCLPQELNKYISKFKNPVHFIELDSLTDGAATTLEYAIKRIPSAEAIVCTNSDQYVSSDTSGFIQMVRLGSSTGQILTMEADGNKWSYVERDANGTIVNVVEKVQVSDEATVGVYGWRGAGDALKSIKEMKSADFKVNNEFYVAPSYNFLLSAGGTIETKNIGKLEEQVHGLGTPEDLEIFLRDSKIDSYFKRVKRNLTELNLE